MVDEVVTSAGRVQQAQALRARLLGGPMSLSRGEPQPAFRGARLERGEGGQVVHRERVVAGFEIETAGVEAGRGEVPVQDEGVLVGFEGFSALAAVLVGEAQVIPSLGVAGQQADCFVQVLDGGRVVALLDEFFPAEQGSGAGRGATTEEHRQGSGKKEPDRDAPLFCGQHLGAW